MLFSPVSFALFLLFLVLASVLFALAPAVAFAKLGLDPVLGYLFFLLSLFGGSINIPLRREKSVCEETPDEVALLLQRYFGIAVPLCKERLLAINVGGAILPGLLSLYLVRLVPPSEVIVATVITSGAAYLLSAPVRGVGVILPSFAPPVIAAVTAMLVSRQHAPQIAYISGVMGTIIGADLLRLRQMRAMGATFMSIGGAGVFDGIYLVGIVSVLLAG